MPAIATYPGTVTPLRGLAAFVESEREVFYGRDKERDELARLVIGEGFRAGLLYGEPGVGKTSLLRAGLVPFLRDHGVIALLCDDLRHPIESFTQAVTASTGLAPEDGERPMQFLARVVAQALSGQLYLFILDDVDAVLEGGDESVIGEIGDLFARVVTRSGGRARFLFSCASERVHRFGVLERRTGSLFPPSSRFELDRFEVGEALTVLDRTLAMTLVSADPKLGRAVIQELGRTDRILPADVQIAAMALRELEINSLQQLQDVGGALELEHAWITAAAKASGNERTALRLLAELAASGKPVAYPPSWAATRASVDAEFAAHAFGVFEQKGLVAAHPGGAGQEAGYALAHEILIPRVREIAAPARAAARRAFELLGSKAAENARLSAREFWALRSEGIEPSSPEERAVLDRSKRFFTIIAAVIAAIPIITLVLIYMSMSGAYYMDVDGGDDGSRARVVVRAGKPSLSAFDWLPASPSFGSVVADTGFTPGMITEAAWTRIADHDLTGDLDDDYAAVALEALRPSMASLIDYAATGSDAALASLRKGAEGPHDLVRLLEALRPIARGGPDEVEIVEASLKDASPAVQRAALAVAGSAARRREGVYHDTLAKALTSSDSELRRLAFSAVRALGSDTSRQLFGAALASEPESAARRELLAVVTAEDAAATPSAASAASVLANGDISPATRDKARDLLRRAFAVEPSEASHEAAKLASDAKAPPASRVLAMELLRDFAPEKTHGDIVDDVRAALEAKAEEVRAAALPLYAMLAPKEAAGDLALLLDKNVPDVIREASALAWGEIARRTKDPAARVALEKLLEDSDSDVRARAAEAYGNVGRPAQDPLIKMVKKERRDVAVGAAYGLANSAEVGASSSVAVGGISQLWRKKGRSRRHATEVFARMARSKPAAVYTYLASAARNNEDTGLHAIGVEGLCNGMSAGHTASRRQLARQVDNESVEVRRLVIRCAVDNPEQIKVGARIAGSLIGDPDATIRAEAARVLTIAARDADADADVGKALVTLAGDDDREVRIIAVRALASMGSRAPKEARAALGKTFDRADEAEKLVLLEAARNMGAGDLAQLAITDDSPLVRTAAIDTAMATGKAVASTINSALTDPDPGVRRAALERVASGADSLQAEAIDDALTLAVRDRDSGISQLALTTLARIGALDRVTAQLERALDARSEQERARAAAAAVGLVERDPKQVIELLEPLIDDASHDVRAAALPALARAYALTLPPDQLTSRLRAAERHAMRRLVATAAFVALAEDPAKRDAAGAALAQVAESGPPLAATFARLGQGLISGAADGLVFLQLLVP